MRQIPDQAHYQNFMNKHTEEWVVYLGLLHLNSERRRVGASRLQFYLSCHTARISMVQKKKKIQNTYQAHSHILSMVIAFYSLSNCLSFVFNLKLVCRWAATIQPQSMSVLCSLSIPHPRKVLVCSVHYPPSSLHVILFIWGSSAVVQWRSCVCFLWIVLGSKIEL